MKMTPRRARSWYAAPGWRSPGRRRARPSDGRPRGPAPPARADFPPRGRWAARPGRPPRTGPWGRYPPGAVDQVRAVARLVPELGVGVGTRGRGGVGGLATGAGPPRVVLPGG